MSPSRPPRVTVTGDRRGDYVVVEERPDGALLLVPEDGSRQPRQPPPVGGVIGNLFRRRSGPTTVAEALEQWGIVLRDRESVAAFALAEVDGVTGFVAVTTRRFLFVAGPGQRAGLRREHALEELDEVQLVRRGLRRLLAVTWAGSEVLIGAPDRRTLRQLEQALRRAD